MNGLGSFRSSGDNHLIPDEHLEDPAVWRQHLTDYLCYALLLLGVAIALIGLFVMVNVNEDNATIATLNHQFRLGSTLIKIGGGLFGAGVLAGIAYAFGLVPDSMAKPIHNVTVQDRYWIQPGSPDVQFTLQGLRPDARCYLRFRDLSGEEFELWAPFEVWRSAPRGTFGHIRAAGRRLAAFDRRKLPEDAA